MSGATQFTDEELSHNVCPNHIQGQRREAWFHAKMDLLRALSLTTSQSHPPGLTTSQDQTQGREGDHAQSKLQEPLAESSKGPAKSSSPKPTHSNVHSYGSKEKEEDEEGDGTSLGDVQTGVAQPPARGPRTPLHKGGEVDPLMADVEKTLGKNPILHFESRHTQMSALKVSRKKDRSLALQHFERHPPPQQVEEEEEEEVHEIASGSEEEYDEEETDDEVEEVHPPEGSKKRKGQAQKDTVARKKAKLEVSLEKQTTRKRGGKAKVPFAMARRLIALMIFDEEELRNLSLDFT